MTDELAKVRAKIAADEARVAARWRQLCKVSPQAAELYAGYEKAAAGLKRSAAMTRGTVEKLRKDDTLYPEGKLRLIREALAKGRDEQETYRKQMDGNLAIVKALLAVSATPVVPPARESLARSEARLVLDASPDPLTAMVNLAERGGELAGVVSGSWGRSYLVARGTERPQEAHENVKSVARAVAVGSDDPALRAAASTYKALQDAGQEGLQGVRDRAVLLAGVEMEAAEAGEVGV